MGSIDFTYRPTTRLMNPAEVLAERQALQAGQQRNALMQLQLQQAQAEAAQAPARNALMMEQAQARSRFLNDQAGNMGPPQAFNPAAAMLAGLKPEEMRAMQGAPAQRPLVLGPGAAVVDPTTGRPMFTNPFKPEAQRLPPIGELQAYRETLPQGDPRRREVDALINNQTRPPASAAAGPSPAQIIDAGGASQIELNKRFGKPPADHRWKPDGTAEVIPGSATDRKRAESDTKQDRSREAAVAQANRVVAKVDQALQSTGLLSAGVAARLLNFPGTPARDLQTTLETIKANLGFAELQAMRDASPTGGALGQVAVQELIALQSTVASLDGTQSPEQLRKSLTQIRDHYTRWRDAVQRARTESEAAAPATSSAPAQVRRFNPATGKIE